MSFFVWFQMGKLSMKSATKVDVASDAALTTKSAKKGKREAKNAIEIPLIAPKPDVAFEQAVQKKVGYSLEAIKQAIHTEPKKKKKGVDVASDAALTTKSAKNGKREAQDVIETPLIVKKLKPKPKPKPKLALEQAIQKNNVDVDANTPIQTKIKQAVQTQSQTKKKEREVNMFLHPTTPATQTQSTGSKTEPKTPDTPQAQAQFTGSKEVFVHSLVSNVEFDTSEAAENALKLNGGRNLLCRDVALHLGARTPHSGGESNLNQGGVEAVCLSGFDSCLDEVEVLPTTRLVSPATSASVKP